MEPPRTPAEWAPGPAEPSAPGSEVHLWRVDLDAPGWPDAGALPSAERARAARKLRPEAGHRWAASRWALRTILGRYLDEDAAAVSILAAKSGKPRLAGDQGRLRFNLSHSGRLALVALATETEVGVDLERIDPTRNHLAVAERRFAAAAAAAVRAAAASDRAAVFYAEWAQHEALLKCLGVGVFATPPAGVAVRVASLDVEPGYAAAFAVAADRLPPSRHFRLDP